MSLKHPEPIHALDAAQWLLNQPSRTLTDGKQIFGVIDFETLFMTTLSDPRKVHIGVAYFERYMLHTAFYDNRDWTRYQRALAEQAGKPPSIRYKPVAAPQPPKLNSVKSRVKPEPVDHDNVAKLRGIITLLIELRAEWEAEPLRFTKLNNTIKRLLQEIPT